MNRVIHKHNKNKLSHAGFSYGHCLVLIKNPNKLYRQHFGREAKPRLVKKSFERLVFIKKKFVFMMTFISKTEA
jgi:hypothetical protein